MKSIATLLSLIALVATCPVATAQTNPTAPDNNQPATTVAAPTPGGTVTTTAVTATAVTTTAPAGAPQLAADAPAATTTVTTTTTVETPATSNAATATAPDAAASASAHDPNAVIPLIVMDEVPLTDAIKNLARQASLNYMLDPKINYGTPDANGVVHPVPTISLRWENLTADQALNAVLKNYNLVLVDDPKTHIALITVKDPAAPEPLMTKIIQLKYSSASNMVAASSAILVDKRSKVIPDTRTSQIVVVATESEIVAMDELVARLDTPTKEVLIEARIVETEKNPTTAKGVDWTGTLQAQNVRFGNNVAGGAAGQPFSQTITVATNIAGGFIKTTTYGPNNTIQNPGLLVDTAKGLDPTTAFLNADGLSAVLSFLNTDADAQILSTPRAVTLDNEEAVISVTTAQPIFLTTAGTQGSPGGSQVTYTNVGTILHVTPRISANNTINLRVIPEVSTINPTIVQKTVAGVVNQADAFDIRSIDTRVLIPSGNTLVMGGLLDDNRTKSNTKVPGLGDIPVLGWAFRSETKTQDKKNLIIFITPTIVNNDDFQPTETAFLKTKLPNFKNDDFGAWDSGEPQDWSKLMHSKKDDATTATGYPSN